jgi:DNA invertase Pin-like site-specific DNA recombinase
VRRGINVHIAKQGMVLDGSMQSRITATVLGLAAEIERELIVLRTTEALAKRKAEGKILGRPKGRQSTHLKLDTREAEIRKYLDKARISHKWEKNTWVSQILDNLIDTLSKYLNIVVKSK